MTRQAKIAFKLSLAAIGLLGGGSVAFAVDHPPFVPTRDVAVVYQVEASQLPPGPAGVVAQGPHTVKMIYSASSGRLRIEQTTMPGYMLIDRNAGRITMVVDQLQSFMEMPFDARSGAGLLLNDNMRFTREGADKVAGLACVVWMVVRDKTTAKLCITADGVILRGEGSDPGHGEGKLLATAVTYGNQPEVLFSPPRNYRRMVMPAMPPGVGAPKPARPPG